MFDLEQAISDWRKKLEKHPGLEPGYIEELEAHLRDKTETLTDRGFTEEEAFQQAVTQFEDAEDIAVEFHKARSKSKSRPAWQRSGWIPTMLPNYIKMAFREFRKQKLFPIINILGLSVGLACCLLIFLYIFQQLQYDQFHPESDRLFRITYEVTNQDSREHYAVSVPGLVPALQETFPEVEKAVRVSSAGEYIVNAGDRQFKENKFFHADSAFFDLFGFSLKHGNPQTALKSPGKVVLSQDAAEKYFGEINPVGKILSVIYEQEAVDLEISGVVSEQNKPSHFSFNMLVSFETLQNLYPVVSDDNWWMRSIYSYVKLSEPKDAITFQDKLPSLVDDYMEEMMQRSGSSYKFHMQPVADIHLYSHLRQEIQADGNVLYIYLFGSIAVLVLLIACFNYMNLVTAGYVQRTREVGVRKSLGASRGSLVKQFIGESLVFTLIAVLLSLVLAWFAQPVLEKFTGQTIHLNSLNFKWIALGLPLIWLITGIISGSYPAFFLSSFEPQTVLKGTLTKDISGAALRKTLVVVQFAISMALIIGAGIVYQQLNYVENKPLGYDRNQVLVIPNGSSLFNITKPVTVENEFNAHSAVKGVAFASHYPTHVRSNNTMVRPEGAPEDARYNITLNSISAGYHEVLELDIVDGRNFSYSIASDSTAFIVNEAAARYFGWNDPIGKEFYSVTDGARMGEVIGIFKDFHVQSLFEQIEPVIFTLGPVNRYDYTLVRYEHQKISSMLRFLEKQWAKLNPGYPFEYTFLDSRYEAQYESQKRLGQLVSVFSALAILIACLGLFGLAAYMARQRTKEIGVRKVLGATASNIVTLLSKDFLKLVVIGFVIAIPIAWYAMNQWLADFAYSIEIGPGIFALAGGVVLVIALLTVSWQSIRAAVANPVDSLRSE